MQFLKLLLDAANHWVSFNEFKDARLANPPKLKHDLMKQLEDEEIGIVIATKPGAYMLTLETD